MQWKLHILVFDRIEDSTRNVVRLPAQVSNSLKTHEVQKWYYGPLAKHKNHSLLISSPVLPDYVSAM